MKTVVDPLQAGLINMRIDLGGRNICMAQHLLNLPEVGSTGKQMCGKTVPHGVGADTGRCTADQCVLLYEFLDGLAA